MYKPENLAEVDAVTVPHALNVVPLGVTLLLGLELVQSVALKSAR